MSVYSQQERGEEATLVHNYKDDIKSFLRKALQEQEQHHIEDMKIFNDTIKHLSVARR